MFSPEDSSRFRSIGTMAHSFVQAHDDEMDSFAHFADANSGDIVFLLDTYDTEEAAHKVTRLAAD